MSKPERMIIDDLIVLGRGCPEEIKNGRQTICTAGYSPKLGFIRLYPTRWDSPLKRWNIVRVPVEKSRYPHNGRKESWKIVGSKRDWMHLSDRVEVVGNYLRVNQPRLIKSLVSKCVSDIYDNGGSLGIIEPSIMEHYFEEQEPVQTIQTNLFGELRVKIKDEFEFEPRIKYKCSECKAKRGFHDQQVIEWGAYEFMRKFPHKKEQIWENLALDNNEYEKYFLVGNMHQYPTAFLIISILRFKKSKTEKLTTLQKFFDSNLPSTK